MILFWGLKKFPLRREIPALKDHLNPDHNPTDSEYYDFDPSSWKIG